jgi:hypothetical protein
MAAKHWGQSAQRIARCLLSCRREQDSIVHVVRSVEHESERRRHDEVLLILYRLRKDGQVALTQSEICQIMNATFGRSYTKRTLRARVREAEERIVLRKDAGFKSVADSLEEAIRLLGKHEEFEKEPSNE